MKNSVKNMIVSVNEMHTLNSKSVEIKDMSEKFQQGTYDIERKMRGTTSCARRPWRPAVRRLRIIVA